MPWYGYSSRNLAKAPAKMRQPKYIEPEPSQIIERFDDVNSVHGKTTKEARIGPALTAQPAKWALRHKKGPLI
jgi:hypothetical protein